VNERPIAFPDLTKVQSKPEETGEGKQVFYRLFRRHKSPRVSVIIPCYNYDQYLQECVESVIAQTYKDFEIIIVNDGSTDNSQQAAEKLIADYPGRRILLINQPNSGQPAISRNRGIAQAQGSYILPLDADDKIAPTMIEECIRLLESDPAVAIAYTDALFMKGTEHRVQQTREYDFHELPRRNLLCYCSLYRRCVWTEVGGYRENVRGYEDWDFWIACGEKGYFGRRIPKPLFLYRVKQDGVYSEAVVRDQYLKAQIALNHPALYSEETLKTAMEVLKAEQQATS